MAKATTIFNAIKVNLKYANYGSFEKFVQALAETAEHLPTADGGPVGER